MKFKGKVKLSEEGSSIMMIMCWCQQMVGGCGQTEAHIECWEERNVKCDCKKKMFVYIKVMVKGLLTVRGLLYSGLSAALLLD